MGSLLSGLSLAASETKGGVLCQSFFISLPLSHVGWYFFSPATCPLSKWFLFFPQKSCSYNRKSLERRGGKGLAVSEGTSRLLRSSLLFCFCCTSFLLCVLGVAKKGTLWIWVLLPRPHILEMNEFIPLVPCSFSDLMDCHSEWLVSFSI